MLVEVLVGGGGCFRTFESLVWVIFEPWISRSMIFEDCCGGRLPICETEVMVFDGFSMAFGAFTEAVGLFMMATGAISFLTAIFGLASVLPEGDLALQRVVDVSHIFTQGADVDLLVFVSSSFFDEVISVDFDLRDACRGRGAWFIVATVLCSRHS